MSKVYFSVTISLDGVMAAPEDRTVSEWMPQWMRLQDYLFHQRFFRRNLGFGDDGETGVDNQIVQHTFERTGATIIGRRMFNEGERMWPEEAPFHTPVFVLTHHAREPWVRPGGTVFHFVTDGVESALRQAREAAGERDIRIGGGPHTVRQFLAAGLVDEFHVGVAPVLLGEGQRLFDQIDASGVTLEPAESTFSPRMNHLRYTVKRVASK